MLPFEGAKRAAASGRGASTRSSLGAAIVLIALPLGCARPHDDVGGSAAIVDHGHPTDTPAASSSATVRLESAASRTVVGAPTASVAAAPSTSSVRATPRVEARRKVRGASCATSAECSAGLACCQSGFRGHCGGAAMPNMNDNPCVFLSSCAPAPCTPPLMPP